MNKNDLLAYLYDWHNKQCLHNQNQDIPFWIKWSTPLGERVLILGAGTGRVAIPLSQDKDVIALDYCLARLQRAKMKYSNIKQLLADFRTIPLMPGSMNVIIAPYNSLQTVAPERGLLHVIKDAHNTLVPGGMFAIDMSDRFAKASSFDWSLKVSGACPTYGEINEWQRAHAKTHTWELDVCWKDKDQQTIIETSEIWYHERKEILLSHLSYCGFMLKEIISGYGDSNTLHKSIYVAVKM